MLGEGQLNQRVAQVAAWNLANGMSFEKLAAKEIHHLGSQPEPYFNPHELRAAVAVAGEAVARGEQASKEAKDKGDGKSLKAGETLGKVAIDDKSVVDKPGSEEPAFGTGVE